MIDIISRKQSEFEAEVLRAFFDQLKYFRVRYAVLRNYELLPESVGARDIDIIVHPDDLNVACDLIKTIAKNLNLHFGNVFMDERISQFALIRRDTIGGLQQIKIDFFTCSEVYGVEFLSAEAMLHDLREYNGIPVVSDHILLLDKWIFHLLVGKPLHSKYDLYFAQIATKYKHIIICKLSSFVKPTRAKFLVNVLADGRGSSLLLTGRERRKALLRLWVAQGVMSLPRTLRFLAYRLRDTVRPHGVFLSISGPDGAGKTTVIDMVVEQLTAIYGDSTVNYAHFRPKVLPRIAHLAKKSRAIETVDENYDEPHRAKPSGFIGSTFRLFYYCLDYIVGYFKAVQPILKRREVMLFDRYYYDMIADGFRSRISLPMPLLKVFGRMLPLPRYAFFIHVDPHEIHRRKQELTFDQIVKLNVRYEHLAEQGWLVKIDNNQSPQKAAIEIIDYIIADRATKLS